MNVINMLLKFALIAFLFSKTKGEMFTALVDMEHLIYREREMLSALRNYVFAENAKLQRLKAFLERLEETHSYVGDNVGSFLGHPVNSYSLINRYYKDWPRLEDEVQRDNSEGLLDAIAKHKNQFATKEDYEGAIAAFFRVQDTYKVDPRELSEGRLRNSAIKSPRMRVLDTYDVGRVAYLANDMDHTKSWMQEALRKVENGESSEGVSKFNILDHLSYSLYQLGNIKQALNLTHEMVKIDPSHSRAQSNIKFFGLELKKKRQARMGEIDDVDEVKESKEEQEISEDEHFQRTKHFLKYQSLCRGEVRNLTRWEESQMECWYHNQHPRLLLKPQKVERVFARPEILYFIDMVSDEEIEAIKEMVKPRLSRATIQHPVTGKLEYAPYRISKSGWLKDWEDPMIARISQRVEDVTGLEMQTAEELQVVNYGIGGHYEPHYDFARENEDKFSSLGTGNRIATWILYMSDVEAGGGTVFTRAETEVRPRKGSAAFWYNLRASGDGDDFTRHAACPVLVGNKWVANKWIHEAGQEFRRKCKLSRWK